MYNIFSSIKVEYHYVCSYNSLIILCVFTAFVPILRDKYLAHNTHLDIIKSLHYVLNDCVIVRIILYNLFLVLLKCFSLNEYIDSTFKYECTSLICTWMRYKLLENSFILLYITTLIVFIC